MDYNRVVAYIYAYNNGLKNKNTGFAKIENRDSRLRLQINMKYAYTEQKGNWDTYVFFRKEGKICGIRLGQITLQNGNGEFRYVGSSENIENRGVDFDSIKGLFICNGEDCTRCFASEWDDLGFDTEKIDFEWMEQEEADLTLETAVTTTEELHIQSVEEAEEEIIEIPTDAAIELSAEMPIEATSELPAEMPTETVREMPTEAEPFETREVLHIFSDDDLYDCVEIDPEDILSLPNTNWSLKNNSFVNHGYYNFRHLLFGRIYDTERKRYFIGVPGVYSRRDRNTAAMYGFMHFKFSMRSDIRLGQFGYWYRELDMK